MTSLRLIFLIVAIVLFILAGLNAVNHPRINLLAWGLAFFAAAHF